LFKGLERGLPSEAQAPEDTKSRKEYLIESTPEKDPVTQPATARPTAAQPTTSQPASIQPIISQASADLLSGPRPPFSRLSTGASSIKQSPTPTATTEQPGNSEPPVGRSSFEPVSRRLDTIAEHPVPRPSSGPPVEDQGPDRPPSTQRPLIKPSPARYLPVDEPILESNATGEDSPAEVSDTARRNESSPLSQEKMRESILKAKRLFSDIKDVRDELNILRAAARFQKGVQRSLYGGTVKDADLSADFVESGIQEIEAVAARIQSAVSVTTLNKIYDWPTDFAVSWTQRSRFNKARSPTGRLRFLRVKTRCSWPSRLLHLSS